MAQILENLDMVRLSGYRDWINRNRQGFLGEFVHENAARVLHHHVHLQKPRLQLLEQEGLDFQPHQTRILLQFQGKKSS